MTDATSQPTGPLTPEEIADRLVPDKPAISPDGANVAFTVAPGGKKGEHAERSIWLSRNGGKAEQFTSGIADDGAPVWSPDGQKLLFSSDRAKRGESKLYTISLNGGEAKALGDLEGELSAPTWSPDGKLIAVMRVDPETAEEKKKKEDRHDPIVVEEQPKFSRLWIVDAATGKARKLTYGKRHVLTYRWSPDSASIAFVATSAPEIDLSGYPTPVSIVPASGGLPKTVATLSLAADAVAFVTTPDGPAIAALVSDHRDDPTLSIWLLPLEGKRKPRNLLPGYEGNIEWMGPVSGDCGSLYIRSVERTHANLYKVDMATGELTSLTPEGMHNEGSVIAGPSFSADGEKVALVWSDGDKMGEVYTGATSGKTEAVTELGKRFEGRLCPVEIVTWQSDGHEIEGLLTYPAGYEEGKRYPLVVEIHGGPSWQWEDYAFVDWHDWAQMLATNGFAVLAPNPRGSTGRGAAFAALLQDDVGGGESRDLINGAQAMVERGIADPDRLGIGGWSWGGYLTAFTITQTTIFKAAVMGAGLSNMISDHGTDDIPSANLLYYPGQPYHHLDVYWESSAIKHITKVTTPTLILHGDSDDRVHPSQGAEMFRALKVLGVPVQFVRYPREPHGIKERAHQIDLMTRLLGWYTKWLNPEKPPTPAKS